MRYAFQLAAQLRPVLLGSEKVAAIGHQGAHFLRHAPAEIGRAAGESDDHGIGVLAQQAEDPLFEPLLHRLALMAQRTAQAASGVTAASAATAV